MESPTQEGDTVRVGALMSNTDGFIQSIRPEDYIIIILLKCTFYTKTEHKSRTNHHTLNSLTNKRKIHNLNKYLTTNGPVLKGYSVKPDERGYSCAHVIINRRRLKVSLSERGHPN